MPSWPWTLSPTAAGTATGRSRPGRAIATPGRWCRCGSGRACCGRRSTYCSPHSPAGPYWRETSGGCAPLWCPWGASVAWGVQSGRCLLAGPPCGSTCSSSSSTAWSSRHAGCRPQGPAARTTSLRGTCHGAQEVGPRRARTRLCARSARGRWELPGRAHHRRRTSCRHHATYAPST